MAARLRTPAMCYQLVELYSACKCLYYQHAVDKCAAYGRRGHGITERTILVGYACSSHSSADTNAAKDDLDSKISVPVRGQKRETLKTAISKIRKVEHGVPKENRSKALRKKDQATQNTIGGLSPTSAAELIPESVVEKSIEYLSPETARDEVITSVKHGESSNTTKHDAEDQITFQDGQADTTTSRMDDSYNDGILSDAASAIGTVFDDGTGGSYTSTLSSVTSPDLVDPISNGLLYDIHLQYLWPQFFLRTTLAQDAFEQIARLLLRYSLDLQASAIDLDHTKSNHKLRVEAARFLERQRYNIAREICAMFPTSNSDHAAKYQVDAQIVTPEVTSKHDTNSESTADTTLFQDESFVNLKHFLFDTEPFYCFRENIRLSVEQPLALPFHTKVLDSARTAFSNTTNNLIPAKKPPSMKRLHCVCHCGQRFFDDYTETRPGALEDLKVLLNQHGINTKTGTGDLESNVPRRTAPSATIGSPANTATPSSAANRDFRLPQYWQKQGQAHIGKCKKSPAALHQPRVSHNYLLACLPLGRWASKLYQAEICTIDSDQDFFSLLRILYRNSRSTPLLSRLRRVKAIHFVQLEMYRTEVADLRAHPAIPPETHKGDYIYEPMPTDLMPPIGPNVLVHFFDHPTHAGLLPDLYRRIPKKLRQKLEPCPVKGSSPGWGLAFEEELDTFLFFLCGLLGFLCCFIVAIVWTVVRDDDVQGDFGIGSFLLGFLVFVDGLVQTSLSTRGGL